jgi:DNA-binding transcriptional LysR family regulator
MLTAQDFDIRRLLALETIVREGSINRAAQRLGYTQSAISQQIAALEKSLGGKVLERPGGPRPVQLTPLGERLLSGSRDVLARLDWLGEDLARFARGETGSVTIGTFQSASARLLPAAIALTKEQRPEAEIRVIETDQDEELLTDLRSGELDLTFAVGREHADLETRFLFADPFVLLARTGQFPQGPVTLATIAHEPLIGQQENSCQMINERAWQRAGLEPQYVLRTNDNSTVAAMVLAGLGVAMMPHLCIDPAQPGIAIHPTRPAFPARELGVAWRPGHLSPLSTILLENITAVSQDFAELTP